MTEPVRSLSDRLLDVVERTGQTAVRGVEDVGRGAALLGEGMFWSVAGWRFGQPLRIGPTIALMAEIGVAALPIVAVLSLTIGAMLAIQGIHTLKTFGAESKVVLGVALSVTREFAPLITGILVAGRSGSALAARLATMKINQEIDALKVMGISPVRYLVSPALVAMMLMTPALTFLADLMALFGAGLYVALELGMSLSAYASETIEILTLDDLLHGLGKSILFALLITVVAVLNGGAVQGGAEGVGRVTTRAVVQAISAIVITDMLFAFVLSR